MIAYNITYEVKGQRYTKSVDAKELNSAKKKLGKKHGYTTGRMVKVLGISIIGYF